MKDKNQLIGWILIAIVLFGWTWYSQKDAAQRHAEQVQRDSIENVRMIEQAKIEKEKAKKETAEKMAELADTLNPLHAARQIKESTTVIKNGLLALTVSSNGAQLKKAEILNSEYKNQDGGNVVLFDGDDNSFVISIDGKDLNIQTSDFEFEPKNVTESSVTMSLPVAGGSLDITYELVPETYFVNMTVQAKDLDGFFPSTTKSMNILWKEAMKQQEKGYDFENRYATITYRNTENDTEELSSMGGDEEEDEFDSRVKWISYKDQFFSQILIADNSMAVNSMASKKLAEKSGYLKAYTTDMKADFDPKGVKPTAFTMYLGPNKFSTLKDHEELLGQDDLDLQSLVYLGWPVIRWINRFVFLYIFDWMTGWGLNMGIVLLLLTIAVKLAVFPLMKKSHIASSKMRVLRPKLDELAKKYPDPSQAMQKQTESMQLYSEYGANPMGGCLPMLIQMPIYVALFNFIPNAIELRGESFLWAKDLSTYDDVINWGFNIWGIGDHLSLFCVLWCVTTVAMTFFTMRQQQDAMTPEQAAQMGMMKWFQYLMPIIFFFTFNGYSSGLTFYYFISTLMSVLIMWVLRKTTDDEALLRQMEERRKQRKADAANGKKPSSMFARLQELQQMQMEMQKQNQAQKK